VDRFLSHRSLALVLACTLLVGCREEARDYSGYIDADMIYLSGSYPGRLSKLLVARGSRVTAGQTLFRLDQALERLDVTIDESSLSDLEAERAQLLVQIDYARKNYRRQVKMGRDEAASTDEIETAERNLEVLKGQLKSIDARISGSRTRIERGRWQSAQKDGVAPDAGLVFDTYLVPGEYSQAGQPVLSLVTAARLKITFFVPEAALSTIRLGQKILARSDGTDTPLAATIDYIANQAEYTPPVIFSREERQKLVFKVIARPAQPDLERVHLGQPVSVSLVHD
jgi:HlyD family secretion protein